jgi:hypothetical protein
MSQMSQILILQYINGIWVDLGIIGFKKLTDATRYVDVLQVKLISDTPGTITFRGDLDHLLVVNLNHGPLRVVIRSE